MIDAASMSTKDLRALLSAGILFGPAKDTVVGELASRDAVQAKPTPTDSFRSNAEREMAQLLDVDQRAGRIKAWKHEAMTLKLADDTRFTPDFLIEHWERPYYELREVKGERSWEDAIIKYRIAKSMYPHFRWTFYRKHLKRNGGHWTCDL